MKTEHITPDDHDEGSINGNATAGPSSSPQFRSPTSQPPTPMFLIPPSNTIHNDAANLTSSYPSRHFHDFSLVPSPGRVRQTPFDLNLSTPAYQAPSDMEDHSYALGHTDFGQSPYGLGALYEAPMTGDSGDGIGGGVGDSAVSKHYSLPSLGPEYTGPGSTPSTSAMDHERGRGENSSVHCHY
jgi:hypothetical protein